MVNQRLAPLALVAAGVMLAACDEARTLEAREEGATVGTCAACHGFPPPAPHPQSQSCSVCHPQTVDESNQVIPGGAHENGRVDPADVSFGHPADYLSQHSGDAIRDIRRCSECHGANYDGGFAPVSCTDCHALFGFSRWQSNCTFCHGGVDGQRDPGFTLDKLAEAAPPVGVRGGTSPSDPQVGAHQKHLGNGSLLSNGFQCQTCHALGGSLDHLDGQAQVTFEFLPLASTDGATPAFTKQTQTCSSVYCHGSTLEGGAATEPRWTAALACNACHGLPPSTGLHADHARRDVACARCHAGYTDSSVNPDTHVDGSRDAVIDVNGQRFESWTDGAACVVCHR